MTSPPVRSLYRKIQVVIEEARRGKSASLDSLADSIVHAESLDFTYYRLNAKGRATVASCSNESVKRIVLMCRDLGLIEGDTGKLTPAGMRAASGRLFDSELRHGIFSVLKAKGVSYDEIDRAIRAVLVHATPESVPTWDVILGRLVANTDKRSFQAYLTLLSHCGGIGYTRKKIYLPKE